jgi:hypothetical protein
MRRMRGDVMRREEMRTRDLRAPGLYTVAAVVNGRGAMNPENALID